MPNQPSQAQHLRRTCLLAALLSAALGCAAPRNPELPSEARAVVQDQAAEGDTDSAEVQAPAAASPDRGSLTVTFANDLFAQSDGNFSNGVGFLWTSSAVDDLGRESFLKRYADFWSFLPVVGQQDTSTYVSFGIGQIMSTPTDITVANPPPGEQPYAGLLAASTGLHAETERSLHSWWVLLGVIGPSSGAEQTQKAIHELTNSDPPQGWDTQLSDEPVLNVYYDWRHRLATTPAQENWGADLVSSTGGGLGNAWIGAWTGVFGRVGYNLPSDYGPTVPRAGLSAAPLQIRARSPLWKVYGFAGVDGQWVGRNIFLDGNNWTDSRSVDSEPWVGAVSGGVGVERGAFALTFAAYSLTDTYETQIENNSFGVIALSFQL